MFTSRIFSFLTHILIILVIAAYMVRAEGQDPVQEHPTLERKVLCGYQGWFRCPGDGSGQGWIHWCRDPRAMHPDEMAVDMWPDMSEYSEAERFQAANFTYPDGSPAYLFSSHNERTVMRHFKWMEKYGIDGVVFQHFAVDLPGGPLENRFNGQRHVLDFVRKAAKKTNRVWAMSYDTAGMPTEAIFKAITDDWKRLADSGATSDPGYVYQDGKPVLVIWGFFHVLGNMTPDVANQLIDFFHNEGKYRVFLIGGGDWDWRQDKDEEWNAFRRRFDGYIPWNVGNLAIDKSGVKWAQTSYWKDDMKEAKKQGTLWIPVAYPGFSWDNLQRKEPGTSLVPRLKGRFLWNQFYEMGRLGAKCAFVAMFDELDEGTAIFKVTDTPPTNAHFVDMEGMPSDWYLRLVGAGTKMLRGEMPLTSDIPIDAMGAKGN